MCAPLYFGIEALWEWERIFDCNEIRIIYQMNNLIIISEQIFMRQINIHPLVYLPLNRLAHISGVCVCVCGASTLGFPSVQFTSYHLSPITVNHMTSNIISIPGDMNIIRHDAAYYVGPFKYSSAGQKYTVATLFFCPPMTDNWDTIDLQWVKN